MKHSFKPSFSVGIMCFNEEKNILQALKSIEQQTYAKFIREIVIISSGSTDKTDTLIQQYAKKHKNILLLRERQRKGKAHAVNLYLSKAKSDLLVLMSADTLLVPKTFEHLISPLRDSNVGIVGAHPIPINDSSSLIGYAVHLQWKLHHLVSLKQPKMGEVIAFRKIFKKIPVLSAVDEVNIESLIRGQGYRAVYSPKAIIYNKGPESIRDFIKVRRRIYAGHTASKHEYSYTVSTLHNWFVLQLLFSMKPYTFKQLIYLPAVIALEGWSRILGYLDYKTNNKRHAVWDIASSTKDLSRSITSLSD